MYEKIGVLSTLFMFLYSGLMKLISKIQRNSDSERMIKILPVIQEYAIPLIVLAGILEVAAVAFIVRDVLSDGVLDDPYSLYALMSFSRLWPSSFSQLKRAPQMSFSDSVQTSA